MRSDLKLLEAFWNEPVERLLLANGITLIVKADRSAALASVQVWVKTGSQHEGDHLGAGLSHYLEHMLFKGTERRAGREISATVQAHGGYINAYTTFDRTVYYIDLPSEHVDVALDVLADSVLHSTLPADEAAKEKDVILREIAMTRDDPDNRFWEDLFATAFRVHPYRFPIIGHREVFAAVTREDLQAYYKVRYVPENLVVVVVGDVDPAAIRAAVEAKFGRETRRRTVPALVPAEPIQLGRRESHRFEDVELTRAGLAWQIPGLTDSDAPVLDLLAMVLGHGDSSILWQAIREKARLVHTIDAQSWNPGSVGLFCITYTCDADKRVPAAAAIQRALVAACRRGFTAAELRKAYRQVVVGEINTRKTMAGQASRLGAAEVVVGDLNHSRRYFEQLSAVKPADLVRAIRKYLVPELTTSVSLSPAAASGSGGPSTARTVPGRPDFEEVRLPNGATLLLQPDRRLPNLHLRLLCLGGPQQERPDRRGSSGLFATLLAKDTRRRSAAQVARYIEEVGGSFHPFSGNNSLGLAAEVLPDALDRALEVLRGGALEPAFRASTFEIEREAQLAELQQDADDVVTFGRKLLRKKFFGTHPLAVDAQGEPEGVRGTSLADLQALQRRLVAGSNVVLAVAGDFSVRELKPRLKGFLAAVPKGPRQTVSNPGWRPPGAGDFVEKQPREQAVLFQAFPGPALLEPDYFVSEVADELFSGMASRLFERVREERGLAYFVRSSRVVGLDAAMFCFYAGTAPDKVPAVLAEIDGEIARIQAGAIEAPELLRCQVRLKAARRQSMQTNGSRAMQAGLNVLYGLPANDWKNFDGRIDAVTVGDLQKFAQKYFQREGRTQLVVTP